MTKFLVGFILGIAVATVGFSGVAKVADRGVSQVQSAVKEAAK